MEQVVNVVRNGFGRNLDFQDIYNHITMPESVYLLRNGEINAMASYNRRVFAGFSCLIVEGIAVNSEIQGNGVFKLMTDAAINDEKTICLRTQNPRMYRALEKYCCETYPNEEESPINIKAAIMDFAKYLNCTIDGNGVLKGYYGGLFYGQEPHHQKIDPLFKKLEVNLHNGDGLLVIGTMESPSKNYLPGFIDWVY